MILAPKELRVLWGYRQTNKNSYSLRQIQYRFARNTKEEVSQRWGREAATFGLRFGRWAHMLGLVGGNPRQLKLGWGRLWYFPGVAWSQAACGALAKRSQDCVQDFNSAGMRASRVEFGFACWKWRIRDKFNLVSGGGGVLVAESCLTLAPVVAAQQAPLTVRLPRPARWGGLPPPPPGISLTQGWDLVSCTAGGFFTDWAQGGPGVRYVDFHPGILAWGKTGSENMISLAALGLSWARRLLLLWAGVSRVDWAAPWQGCLTWVSVEHAGSSVVVGRRPSGGGLSCSTAAEILAPRPGLEPESPELQGDLGDS